MRKLTALLLALILALGMTGLASASTQEPQLIYSCSSNSGVRHQVCTDLSGTMASTYYTGDYTPQALMSQTGDTLLQSLRTLMTQTHTTFTTYDQCRDLSAKTDCENGDGETINLIYTSYVATWDDYINNTTDGGGWNREHVWPKSLGGFNTTGAGADLHHIRPSDRSVNDGRGNKKYGVPTNGNPVNGTVTVESALGGYSDGQYFEPLDNVKGDVARICLYVYVRYGGELNQCSAITNVFQSVDVLLQWHATDPVDTWEMGRNEVIYAIQGNRNVFIDYPELAWLMFEQQIPQDLVTPTSASRDSSDVPAGTTPDGTCAHTNLVRKGGVEPSCTKAGSTGDIYCGDCGAFIHESVAIGPVDNHNFGQWVNGLLTASRTCLDCGYTESAPLAEADIPKNKQQDIPAISVAVAVIVAGAIAAVVILKKKKQ